MFKSTSNNLQFATSKAIKGKRPSINTLTSFRDLSPKEVTYTRLLHTKHRRSVTKPKEG
jgi:hypothetical protein